MNRPNVQQDVGRLGFELKPPTQVFSRPCSMPVCLACSFSASTPVSDWLHVHCFGMFFNYGNDLHVAPTAASHSNFHMTLDNFNTKTFFYLLLV